MLLYRVLFVFCSIIRRVHAEHALAFLDSTSLSPLSISNIYRQLDGDGAVCVLVAMAARDKVSPRCRFLGDQTAAAHYLHHLTTHTHPQIPPAVTRSIGCDS